MNDARFKRIKHRQMPGDVPKKTKIAMREGRLFEPERVKSFVKEIKRRGLTVNRRRYKKEMNDN